MKTLSILKNIVSRAFLTFVVVFLSSTFLFSGFINSNAEELLTPQIYNIGENAGVLITIVNKLPLDNATISRGSISVCFEKTDGSSKNSIQFAPLLPTIDNPPDHINPDPNSIIDLSQIPNQTYEWNLAKDSFDTQSLFIKPGTYRIRVFENQTDSATGVMKDNCYFDQNDLSKMVMEFSPVTFTYTMTDPSQVDAYAFVLRNRVAYAPRPNDNFPMLVSYNNSRDNRISSWNDWQPNGAALTPVTMARFGDVVIFQTVRGTDSNIYTRYKSRDNDNWSSWIPNGATLGQVSMVEYRGTLIQTVRGTDNNIYTRELIEFNGNQVIEWSPWTPSGSTFGEVTTAVYGDQLVQTVRGTDNNIYTRVRRGDNPFGNWTPNGSTFGDISMMTYRNALFQAVKGTDNAIYIRHSFNPQNNEWSAWRFLKDQVGAPVRVNTKPSIGVHNNIMYISATDSSGGITTHIYADRYIESNKYVYTPNANAAYVTTDGVDSVADLGSFIRNQGIQTIVRRDNTIGMRTFSGFPLGQFGAIETIPGNTNLPVQTLEVHGVLIQSYIGTDNQIYTRETITR